jgi:hypothetical protein
MSPRRGKHFRRTVSGFGFRLGCARMERGRRRVAPVSRENFIVLIGEF